MFRWIGFLGEINESKKTFSFFLLRISKKNRKMNEEVIEMALQGKDKQVIELSNELAKKLKEKDFSQSWSLAGELNGLLKNEEELTLSYQVIQCIKNDLASYYDMNKSFNKVANRAFAIGCNLERSGSI